MMWLFWQVIYKTLVPENDIQTLYIQASQEENRLSWISAIREACAQLGVILNDHYHKGVFRLGKYICCDGISKMAPGCAPVSSQGQLSGQQQVTGPSSPVALPRQPQSGPASVLPGGPPQAQRPPAQPSSHPSGAGESDIHLPVFNLINGGPTPGGHPPEQMKPQAQPKEQQGQIPTGPVPKPRVKVTMLLLTFIWYNLYRSIQNS